jgi:ABC-type transporter Mla subunit MlaD
MAGTMVVSTIALVASALAGYGVFKAVRNLQEKVEPLIPEAQRTLNEANLTLAEAKAAFSEAAGNLRDLGDRASRVIDKAEGQLDDFDRVRKDVSERLRVQLERAELVVEDSLQRVHEVVGTVHSGIISPVRQVNGIVSGVKAALSTFLQTRRPSVDRAVQDDDMFI